MQPLATPTSCLTFEDALLDEHVRVITEDKPMARFELEPLNELLGGVYPGQMVGVGATPGSGKTSLMLQLADELAAQGLPVIFVSAELPAHKLLIKSLVRLSNCLSLGDVSHVPDDSEIRSALENATKLYRDSIAPNLCITGNITVSELGKLIAECVHVRSQTPVVFIDYLQLLATSGPDPFADERLAIAACVKQLRDLANSYMVPIYAISTITRSAYGKRKPDLSIFGGAAVIEYSLDAALYLNSEDEISAYGPQSLTLTALKNRYGTTGSVSLSFDAARAEFAARA